MDIMITLKAGQKPTREQLKKAKREYSEAAKYEPVDDPDCPLSTPKALAEFAAMARERRKSKKLQKPQMVAITFKP